MIGVVELLQVFQGLQSVAVTAEIDLEFAREVSRHETLLKKTDTPQWGGKQKRSETGTARGGPAIRNRLCNGSILAEVRLPRRCGGRRTAWGAHASQLPWPIRATPRRPVRRLMLRSRTFSRPNSSTCRETRNLLIDDGRVGGASDVISQLSLSA
ncbi:hypothetical protein GCM10027285_27730 [Oleiagrimonas citrea]